MTTVQKWYLLVIFTITILTYSITTFPDISNNTPIIHIFLLALGTTTSIISFVFSQSDSDIIKHHKYLYKEFIKVIKFYLNL